MNADIHATQGFMFSKANIRGQIVHLEKTYQTIIEQHDYPSMVRYLLGEALVACLLISGSLKFEGDITLQFQGDTTLPLLLAQCDSQLNLRAYAKCSPDRTTEAYAQAFLQGTMALTMNPDHHTQAYQSIIPIYSTDMSENLNHYFVQSEQITTHIWCASDEKRVAAMMLQLMPTPDQAMQTQERENFWQYATQMGETVSDLELLTLDNETLLYRLYNETEVVLFDSRPASFKCRCTRGKMLEVVKTLGKTDAHQLITEQGCIDVTCDFCNSRYSFDAIDVTLLFTDQ